MSDNILKVDRVIYVVRAFIAGHTHMTSFYDVDEAKLCSNDLWYEHKIPNEILVIPLSKEHFTIKKEEL